MSKSTVVHHICQSSGQQSHTKHPLGGEHLGQNLEDNCERDQNLEVSNHPQPQQIIAGGRGRLYGAHRLCMTK